MTSSSQGLTRGTGRTRAGQVRLTRRGRLVVVLVVMALLVVGFSLGQVGQAAGPADRPAPTVTVATGESLWQLAARVAPHADPRLVVAEIVRLNHLRGAQVYPGEQLVLPRVS